jgi:tetratricopeptide (TPR) repeat protein
VVTLYNATIGKIASRRALLEGQPSIVGGGAAPAASAQQAVDAAETIVQQPQSGPEQKAQAAQAYINQGKAYYAVEDYTRALQAYNDALRLYSELPQDSNDIRQAIAVALAGRARSLQKLGREWEAELQRACEYNPGVAEECPQQ